MTNETNRAYLGRGIISFLGHSGEAVVTVDGNTGSVHVEAIEPMKGRPFPAPANVPPLRATGKAALTDVDYSATEARVLGGMAHGRTLIFLSGRLPGTSTIRDAMSALAHAGGDAVDRLKDAVKALEAGNVGPLRNLAEEHVLLFGNAGWPDLKTKVETYRRLYSLGADPGPVTQEELRGLLNSLPELPDKQTEEPPEAIVVPGGAHKKKAKAQWKNEKRGGYFRR